MKWKLHWYLVVPFIVAVVLVSAAATSLGVAQASRELERSLLETQKKSTSSAALALANYLAGTNDSLAATAALIPESNLYPRVDVADVEAVFDPLVAYKQDFAAFFLVDRQGTIIVARPDLSSQLVRPLTQNAAFVEARNTLTSRLNLDPEAAPSYWVVPVPDSVDHAEPFFVVGLLSQHRVLEILFANKERDDRAAVLNVALQVVFASDPRVQATPPEAWQDLRPEGGTVRSVQGVAPTGEPDSILTVARAGPFALSLVLIGDKTEIRALQAQLISGALLTGGALAAAAILLGLFATRTITSPVADIRTAANRMTHGDLAVRAKPRGARELRELADDFNQMAFSLSEERDRLVSLQKNLEMLVDQRTAEVKQKQEEMELFFYGIGHDFKSPVIAISSFSQLADELLQNGGFNKKDMRDYVDRIRRSSQTLQSLITELLQFAQAEHTAPVYRETDASEVLRAVAEEARPFADERGVRVELEGRSLRLTTDPDRLRHVATNLVQNAIKYMPSKRGRFVRVSWRKAGGELVLLVADNGEGIPAEVQKRLFRPFSRHTPSGAGMGGVGLGLSIVKRFVESLHGRIELESTPGRGSTFIIRLPLVSSQGRSE